MHRLLEPADYVRMPWKNGGGHTTQVAAHPEGARVDAFEWRVSVADVAADGPFSAFPGIDRTVVLVAGAGMRLTGSGHAAELRAAWEPYLFRGDDAIHCTLIAGAVRDFNLMVRRARAQGRVTVVREAGARIPPARWCVCYAAQGVVECLLPGHPPLSLAADHALVIDERTDGARAPLAVNPCSGDAVALVASIELVA